MSLYFTDGIAISYQQYPCTILSLIFLYYTDLYNPSSYCLYHCLPIFVFPPPGRGKDGSRDRSASCGAEGWSLLTWWHHHRWDARARKRRIPCFTHQRCRSCDQALKRARRELILYTVLNLRILTLPMLRLLSFKYKDAKIFDVMLVEYSQMSSHVPGFQSFFRIFASFCIG